MSKKTPASPASEKERTGASRPEAEHLSTQEIEEAAYYRWLNRGCPEGDACADWHEAEKEIHSRKQGKK